MRRIGKGLQTYFSFMIHWGIEAEMEEYLKKQIVLCNQMSWLLLHINAAYLVVDLVRVGSLYRSGTTLSMMMVSGLALALTKNGHQYTARIISAFVYSSYVFLYGILIKLLDQPQLIHYLSPRIPLIMFVFFPFIFLDFKHEKVAFYTTYCLNAFFVLAYDPVHYLLGINMEAFGLHLDHSHLMTQNSISFLINISFAFTFFKLINQRYEDRIKTLNSSLLAKTDQIERQNKELLQQTEEIEAVNNNLEQVIQSRTKELHATLDSLIHQKEDLEEFSYIISHNLRSPVNRIQGLLHILNTDHNPSNRQEIMQHLQTTVADLDQITHDLTHIVGIRKKVDKVQEFVLFSEVTNDVLAHLEDDIKLANAQVVTNFSAVDRVYTVRVYWYSIIYNLLSNALKYRSHLRPLEIMIATSQVDGMICYSVADNGIGLDVTSGEADKIFGLYQRVHEHKQGKGLGLYLVKTQIETLGGKVTVHGRPDYGATFEVYLPLPAFTE